MMPIINDFDNRFTVYQQSDNSFCLTGYEKISHIVRKLYKPRASEEQVDFEVPIVPERWQNFFYILDPIVNRIPALRDAEYQKVRYPSFNQLFFNFLLKVASEGGKLYP